VPASGTPLRDERAGQVPFRLIGNPMYFFSLISIFILLLSISDYTFAQTGSMMSGGDYGYGWMHGTGGPWMWVVLIVVVVALVMFIIQRKGK
jgi:hypothetical protein